MDSRPGTYLIILRCDNSTTLTVGQWGDLLLQPGYYCYVGSAFGPGGVRARVMRHLRMNKRKHWHIDYLREALHPVQVWYSHETEKSEHRWAGVLASMAGVVPVSGFGCSDCSCDAHLFSQREMPDIDSLWKGASSRLEIYQPSTSDLR